MSNDVFVNYCEALIDSPKCYCVAPYWFSFDDDKCYISLVCRDDIPDGINIMMIYTEKQHRRKGIGNAALELIMRTAEKTNSFLYGIPCPVDMGNIPCRWHVGGNRSQQRMYYRDETNGPMNPPPEVSWEQLMTWYLREGFRTIEPEEIGKTLTLNEYSKKIGRKLTRFN